MPPLGLITASVPEPLIDTALSNAILSRVANGQLGPTLRVFVPDRIVAFGSQDRIRPGYAEAIDAVVEHGFAAVERLAGGRAAVFHEATIAFAWATPLADSKAGIESRFRRLAAIVLDALERLGIEGAVGETPGEYCPGRFSVHAGGRKVMGVGQRLVGGAAHVGGVVVVDSPELVNLPLVPAYSALGYEWVPEATGSLADTGTVTVDGAIGALLDAFVADGHELAETDVDPETYALARRLAPQHDPSIA